MHFPAVMLPRMNNECDLLPLGMTTHTITTAQGDEPFYLSPHGVFTFARP